MIIKAIQERLAEADMRIKQLEEQVKYFAADHHALRQQLGVEPPPMEQVERIAAATAQETGRLKY